MTLWSMPEPLAVETFGQVSLRLKARTETLRRDVRPGPLY